MKEFIASFKTSRQIGPDDWEVYTAMMKMTDNTTIKEIRDWYYTFCTATTKMEDGKFVTVPKEDTIKLNGISISEL